MQCPNEIYDIMCNCWKFLPEERPIIKSICDDLRVILPNYFDGEEAVEEPESESSDGENDNFDG